VDDVPRVQVQDIPYAQHPGGTLMARVYRPSGDQPQRTRPALVCVHGGAWTSGDRTRNAAFCERLARVGCVVASVDFRMPPEAGYPESVADIHLAVRWLKMRAADWGSSADAVGGVGFSSGGHQLMLVAMRPHDRRYRRLPLAGGEDIDAQLRYVVLCYGVLNPMRRYQMARRRGLENLVNGHDRYWPSQADMAEGDVQLILERGERVELPPILAIQGTHDANLPADTAARFADAYRKAGGVAELAMYDGAPHSFIRTDDGRGAAATERVIRFVFGWAG
jgi:acetyl esterase